LALIIFPMIAQHFGNSWVRIMDMALLYIMLALGLNIVVGFAGLLDLGYIAFYAVGAYSAGLLARRSSPGDRILVNTYPAIGNSWSGCAVRRSCRTASTSRCG
jgi:branched-chain amino acid transport system permease protein